MIELKSFADKRGRLTVMDKVLPFDIKRVYYISGVTSASERGGHAHHLATEAIFCINGGFTAVINNGKTREEFFLNDQTQGLIVEPFDWHMMYNFSLGTILMGVSSTHYDPGDYYYEEPKIL
jgi:dTDP-4-dehydrorhamnose 3,5-epimerase-like enzyme